MFGKWGLELYEKVRGRDDSPIQEACEVKSVGEQETFAKDTRDSNMIVERLRRMCEDVLHRLPESGFRSFRTVVVTVRFADFETKSRSRTLVHPTGSVKDLEVEALNLLLPFLDHRDNPKRKLIRMTGVRVEKLGGEE
jgi:nucleotidyltransferase/DNA polymerase involved in DNA repair